MGKIIELNQSHYDEIFSLSQFAFQYELTEEELHKKKEEAERYAIWGMMDGERIAAKLHLIPLAVSINGIPFEMGGIASVATWPEYRRKGMVKELLLHALQTMKAQGQTISFLHPFSVPFYRQYGWEVAFAEKHYEIPMKNVKQNWNGKGYVRRVNSDIPLLDSIYRKYIKNYNGALLRDEKWWKQRVLKDQHMIAVAYDEENQAEGYIIYQLKDRLFKVDEFVYNTTNALKVFMQFIANHDSMAEKVEMVVPEIDLLPLLVHEPRFKQKIMPYFMARIVDVEAFLKEYMSSISTAFGSLSIRVEDPFIEENTGIYTLHEADGKIDIVYESVMNNIKGPVISCTVQQLITMLLGYQRPEDLYQLELISGDTEAIELLEYIIPRKQTYFTDFF
ncbi:GNAT family N-acetyltransferase [Oceanobacillus alkalisoli]|uniref:GNAT family N-acetyltransferase n=1 Tax=Oceanobacillus alkalisoli TaxID=2925113 RepID=UPI001EE4B8A6|nr:GNAT family N-acetyltransferase [Oceanobacillus alkalisoli]MCG5103303.1 GNAT family N-acetyltransferase [Oceanobacillus alkalisoli]